jgi:hypothetical protein
MLAGLGREPNPSLLADWTSQRPARAEALTKTVSIAASEKGGPKPPLAIV